MDRGRNEWSDALPRQDIPAEVVDWANIIADPDDELNIDAAGYLDADATIGEPEADEE
ncbi:hypothetical protein [Paenibacillus tianjinensis]|uniref:Uncharacterized protein n=1 Tax=Paenibacillus tianjinensis TaxID=2810347 RepID=A0ABX7LIX9_9BACL|nr:hypothetical protein [Paenibacillus tianjinensis]QSF45857.1 hypothetical protein JRJ22_04270 [Paenibacillus tianjinensis]